MINLSVIKDWLIIKTTKLIAVPHLNCALYWQQVTSYYISHTGLHLVTEHHN